jgi:hypothetical protein
MRTLAAFILSILLASNANAYTVGETVPFDFTFYAGDANSHYNSIGPFFLNTGDGNGYQLGVQVGWSNPGGLLDFHLDHVYTTPGIYPVSYSYVWEMIDPHDFTLTYPMPNQYLYYSINIDPAVPEPATWFLLLIGFVILNAAVAQRSGRRVVKKGTA